VCAKRLYNPELGEWRAFATAKIKNAVCDNLKQRKWHPQGRAKVPERIYQPTDWSNELEVWTTSLTKDEREAVVWYYRDGLTLSEIGHRQLHDQSTVSYALKRAREKIRQRLG
jgi:RNA polymerase sigma factor (sigma-70 family)